MRKLSAFLLLSSLAYAGCSSILGEERALYMKRDLNRLHTEDWLEKSTIPEVFSSPHRQEIAAEQQICMHPNSSNRVTTQNGVNDTIAYRHCTLAPYDVQSGARMGIRPDGNGVVIK